MSAWLNEALAIPRLVPIAPIVPKREPEAGSQGAYGANGAIGTACEANAKRSPANECELVAALAELREACPGGVDERRWRMAVRDGRAFLSMWGAVARETGWQPFHLFGLHPTAPLSRVDHLGLIWMLKGKRIVALDDRTATFESGLRFYRLARRPT